MKTQPLYLTVFCGILISTQAFVANAQQKSISASSQVAAVNNVSTSVVNNSTSASSSSARPIQNVPPAQNQQTTFSSAEIEKNAAINKQRTIEIEQRAARENSQGTITINFGVVKQGDNIVAFFPFNIKTLEKKVNSSTQPILLSEFKKFVSFNNPSEISDVRIGFLNGSGQNVVLAKGVNGNGFNVTYSPKTITGAIDESVMVYTSKGNLLLRLTGYVYPDNNSVTKK